MQKNYQSLFTGTGEFEYRDILGGEEKGVTRRDPSPVIQVEGTYYVWYSRTTQTNHGYTATIWYATSTDGIHWTEQAQALARGDRGTFDEHAVFTPSILIADGTYYLSYTGVPEPFYNGIQEHYPITVSAVGMARADHPEGPWERLSEDPVLRTSKDHDAFDSLRVDDSCFVKREGIYLLYYKGRQWDRSPKETKMGVATSSSPYGPFEKWDANPIVEGGHEVCCWPHGDGVAALFCDVGAEGNTLQYSPDGIHFSTVASVIPPKAPGPYREDGFTDGSGPGVSWGICMENAAWPYLVRFDCDLHFSGTARSAGR